MSVTWTKIAGRHGDRPAEVHVVSRRATGLVSLVLSERSVMLDAAGRRALIEALRIDGPEPARRRTLTHEEAEARALQIADLRASGMTQRAIAERLGMDRSLVAHYLSPSNKAMARARARGAKRTLEVVP